MYILANGNTWGSTLKCRPLVNICMSFERGKIVRRWDDEEEILDEDHKDPPEVTPSLPGSTPQKKRKNLKIPPNKDIMYKNPSDPFAPVPKSIASHTHSTQRTANRRKKKRKPAGPTCKNGSFF